MGRQFKSSAESDSAVRSGGQSWIQSEISRESGSRIFVKQPDDPAAFRRESEALSQLSQFSHIARVEAIDNARKTITLIAAPGERLDRILYEESSLQEGEANAIIKQIAEVLHCMHTFNGYGYVHYDLSTANIFWHRKDQDVTVIDFGCAFSLNQIPEQFRQEIVGTPIYLSPEKIRREPEHGCASDIFALGAIWYELLSGSPPFDPVYGKLEDQILKYEPLELTRVSARTSEMVMKLLSKDANMRPNASQLLEWLG